MKVCALSDLHGNLPKIEPCELVLICGDLVSLEAQMSFDKCKSWYENEFTNWVDNLPCEKVLFIPGNHECGVEGNETTYKRMFPHYSKATILFNESYGYLDREGNDYTIFGSPYCKIFGNWAYMRDDEGLRRLYSKIPIGIDILITHDAPYGCSDVCLQNLKWVPKDHLGNEPLRDCIIEKRPKYVFHGHLHTSNREFETLEKSKVINCSIVNEQYKPVFKPHYLWIK